MTMRQIAVDDLERAGIRNVADIRAMIADKRSEHYCKSVYGVIKAVAGEDAADIILNEMALRQCCSKA